MHTLILAVFYLTDFVQFVFELTWVDWAAVVDCNQSLSPVTMLGLLGNGKQTRTASMLLHLLPYSWEWNGVRSALPALCYVKLHTRLTNTNIAMGVYTWKPRHACLHFKGFLFIASIFPKGLIVRTHEEDGAYLWNSTAGNFRFFSDSFRVTNAWSHFAFCVCMDLHKSGCIFCHTHSREIFQVLLPLNCNGLLCAFPLRLTATSLQFPNGVFQK